jgi:hypothetical protein
MLIMGVAMVSFLVQPEPSEPVTSYTNPLDAVDPNLVDPALAVALLAGLSDVDVITQAINKVRPGTALATILYSPNLSAREAAGDFLLLGERFRDKNDPARAILSYQLAGTMATLSPELSDTLRADIFLQAGIGLTKLGEPILAKVYLDQAKLVATDSPYLQAAYRYSVLDSLRQAYLDLGLKDESRISQQLSLEPARLEAIPERALVLPAVQELAIPLDVQQAEAARWRAAQQVAKELVELGGTVRPEAVLELQNTLLAEDQIKTKFYNESLAAESQRSAQISLIRAKIAWQTLKYRIARQGFGISIAPQWEGELDQIRADLKTAYEELYRLYSDLIVAIPIAADIDRATEEALRRQLLAGLLGQYPDYPGEELESQLLSASAKLIQTQPGTDLRVSYLSVNEVEYYTLISDREVSIQ